MAIVNRKKIAALQAVVGLSLIAGSAVADVRLWVTTSTVDGNLGGRAGADAICDADANKPAVASSTTRAFISVSAADEIEDMPGLYSIPTNETIFRGNGTTQIAANFPSLLNAGSTPLTNSVVAIAPTVAWTGSTGTGLTSGTDCSSWTSASNAITGDVGTPSNTNASYLGGAASACDLARALYCITYTAPAAAGGSTGLIDWQ